MTTPNEAFTPVTAKTAGAMPAATTSAAVALTGLGGSGGQVRVAVTGSAGVRVEFGIDATVTATTPTPGSLVGSVYTAPTRGSLFVPAGAVEILSAPAGTTYVAFKTDSGTSTVEFTPGMGL
jgi:hypothetical protein